MHERDILYYLEKYELTRLFPYAYRENLKLSRFKKGEVICTTGDELNDIYFLVEGKIKIYTLSPEGKSLIIRFKRPLGVIGDVEYVKGNTVFNTVEAVSDGLMISASFTDLKKLERDHPPFVRFLLETITQKFYTESQATSLHMLYPVEVRLASYLLSVSSDGEGTVFHEDMRAANLTELAEWIGTSYRHLNRMLKKLETQGIIERSNGSIVIKNLGQLRTLAKGNIYE